MWRWFVAAALVLGTVACGDTSPGVVEKTGDFVFARFWGSVHVHRQNPGSAPWEDVTYHWQEVAMYQIGAGDIVQDPSRVDHLRGTGQGIGDSPLFGSCTVKYDAYPPSSNGTEGIRVLNEGSKVEATAIAPWDLHKISSYSGSFCHEGTDPAGLGTDYGLAPFTCVLEPNQHCTRSAGIPVSPTPGETQTGDVTFTATRMTKYEYFEDEDYLDQVLDDILWLAVVGGDAQANAVVSAPGLPPAPADGTISMGVSQNGVREGTVRGPARKGAVPQLTATWQQTPSAAVPLQVDASYSVSGGPDLAISQTIYLPPAVPSSSPSGGGAAAISGVAFHGSPSNPTIVVTGQNLGSEPAAGPAGHPSGQGGCPAVAGDQGYDYGTSLYIAVPSGNWSAGRYQPSLGETDCFDLVVSKFTDTEVDFTLGALYSQQTKDQLTTGTAYQLVVNGAGFSGTVAYT